MEKGIVYGEREKKIARVSAITHQEQHTLSCYAMIDNDSMMKNP